MRFVRFSDNNGAPVWGRIEGDEVVELTGDVIVNPRETGKRLRADSVSLLPPATPTKIVCIGLNYRSHAREVGLAIPDDPVMFFKPISTLAAPGQPIELPARSRQVEHEAELACVIGKRIFRAGKAEALDAVWGYTCANDVTARDIQVLGGNYINITWSKAYPTFCPIGPWVTVGEIDPDNVDVVCRVNGETRQETSTSDFIFDMATQLCWLSAIMPLEPGDLVLTGTPHGVGPLVDKDLVEVEISGIGTLANPVIGKGD